MVQVGTDLYCANAGDSRAVLCRDGVAVNLSEDHKPMNEEEKLRIEKVSLHELSSLSIVIVSLIHLDKHLDAQLVLMFPTER